MGEEPEESADCAHNMVWGSSQHPPRGLPRCSWWTMNVHHAECLAPGWALERGEWRRCGV